MNFIDWINYIEKNKVDINLSESIDKKFDLIENFLNNLSKIEKEDHNRNQKDISIETLTSENELILKHLQKFI